MALTSTVHVFDLSVSDIDRGVYETQVLKVARHPSESLGYMVARVLAFALELEPGLAFTHGLCAGDEPALWTRDLTGQLRAWIEVGTPDAARLHKASKACERVVVYCHKEPAPWLRSLAGHRVHAPERVALVLLDPAFVASVEARVEKRTALALSITEGQVYADIGGESLTTVIERRPFPG